MARSVRVPNMFQPTLGEALEHEPRGSTETVVRAEYSHVLESLAWHGSNGLCEAQKVAARARGRHVIEILYGDVPDIDDERYETMDPGHAIHYLVLEGSDRAYARALSYARDLSEQALATGYDLPKTVDATLRAMPVLCYAAYNRGDRCSALPLVPALDDGLNRATRTVALRRFLDGDTSDTTLTDAHSVVDWDIAMIDFCLDLKKLGAPTALVRDAVSAFVEYSNGATTLWRPAFVSRAVNACVTHGIYSRDEVKRMAALLHQTSGRRTGSAVISQVYPID